MHLGDSFGLSRAKSFELAIFEKFGRARYSSNAERLDGVTIWHWVSFTEYGTRQVVFMARKRNNRLRCSSYY